MSTYAFCVALAQLWVTVKAGFQEYGDGAWGSHGLAQWCPRRGHSAVSNWGRIFVLGGECCRAPDPETGPPGIVCANDSPKQFDANSTMLQADVWSTANGTQWSATSTNAPWGPRAFHASIVFPEEVCCCSCCSCFPCGVGVEADSRTDIFRHFQTYSASYVETRVGPT